jgi:hypothetical protein
MIMIAAPTAIFLAIVATNLAIDPQGVFGTGVFGLPGNSNLRYFRVKSYSANPDKVDGLLFGSSRVLDFPLDDLSRATGGLVFFNFGVTAGQMTDYLPSFEYVLRDKVARNQRLRAVFLMLDADGFGTPAMTNRGTNYDLPPELTGERPLRFWLRMLTAVQVKTWLSEISRFRRERHDERAAGLWPAPVLAAAGPQPDRAADGAAGGVENLLPLLGRPDLALHLTLLTRFVALCRSNDVALTVAIAPLNRSYADRFDRAELTRVVDEILHIVPVWDFSNPDWLADRQELWSDPKHFVPDVSRILIAKIFGGPA